MYHIKSFLLSPQILLPQFFNHIKWKTLRTTIWYFFQTRYKFFHKSNPLPAMSSLRWHMPHIPDLVIYLQLRKKHRNIFIKIHLIFPAHFFIKSNNAVQSAQYCIMVDVQRNINPNIIRLIFRFPTRLAAVKRLINQPWLTYNGAFSLGTGYGSNVWCSI